jgi:hypothetical protein
MAKTLIDRIAGEVGPPEVLVNSIGGFLLGEAVNATPETLRLSHSSAVRLCQPAAPSPAASHPATPRI